MQDLAELKGIAMQLGSHSVAHFGTVFHYLWATAYSYIFHLEGIRLGFINTVYKANASYKRQVWCTMYT